MKLSRPLTLVASLAVIAVWLFGPAVPGSHADGGTITTTAPTLTYTHGPFFIANTSDTAGPPVCSTSALCDDYTLNVNVPAGTDATQQINIQLTWDQSTNNAAEFDLFVYDQNGNVLVSNENGSSPDLGTIPAVSGTYTVRAVPWFPNGETYTGTISLAAKPGGSLPPDAAPGASGIAPRYQDYAVPRTMMTVDEGEPSIGVDWKTGATMYISGLQTFRVNFDATTSPATATWKDVSAPTTSVTSLDPILFTDHTTGRTFASQLTGQDSLTAFSDDDGASWTPSQGGGIPSGADHQTIGGGPYSSGGTPVVHTYPDAIYYCSQDIATAFCARSDNGGLTFGAGVPTWNLTQCAGIHGHVKVAPDGTVYVPTRACNGHQGVAVSTDNGASWTVRSIPDSTAAIGNDPSVGIGSDGTIYLGYQAADGHARIAVSHDKGATWSKSLDVGAQMGVQNVVFPAVVAGDGNRVSFAYIGTTTAGDFQSQPRFNGVWYLYISTSYDGGKTWSTVNATPGDPVQRGSICISGTLCGNTPDDRNLLDFIDATIDSTGHVQVAYTDGCVDACVAGTGAYDPTKATQSQQSQLNSFTAIPTISRQSGGNGLFSKYDTAQPSAPARPKLSASQAGAGSPVNLSWQAPDNGGSAITSYTLYRGTAPGQERKLVNAGTHLSYQDTKVKSGTTYYYYLVATNAVGSSQPSPEVTPTVLNAKPMCSFPGELVLTDNQGDQKGAPLNPDLDILNAYIEEPGSSSNLVITLQVADLTSPGANHQWRVFWDADATGDRWYVGMDTDASGKPSFVYGFNTGQTTGVQYAPAVPTTTITALPGSGFTPDGYITIVVPKSGVGSPAAGGTLPNVEARTFAGQGDISTVSTNLAEDFTGSNNYSVMGNAYCQ